MVCGYRMRLHTTVSVIDCIACRMVLHPTSVDMLFFFQAEDGIRDLVRSRGLGDVYKRQLFEQGISIQKRWGTPEDVGKVAAAMAIGMLPYSLSLIHI
mgnify:CR=1 FL=1